MEKLVVGQGWFDEALDEQDQGRAGVADGVGDVEAEDSRAASMASAAIWRRRQATEARPLRRVGLSERSSRRPSTQAKSEAAIAAGAWPSARRTVTPARPRTMSEAAANRKRSFPSMT